MITETDVRDVKTFGDAKESSFSLQQSAKIFTILRSNIYSNKILTVIREYSTNAWDSHVLAGHPTRPIHVFLPTTLSPVFKIRDYGVGLSNDDVLNVYTSYGASTKDSSNHFNGTFGLGSKSAFAYGNTFGITSYFNGVKTVFTAYIDESNIGKMRLEFSVPTDEENGIEIEIAVKQSDITAFTNTAIDFYKHFDPCPVFFGSNTVTEKIAEFHNRPVLFSASDWKMIDAWNFQYWHSASVIRMGNVAYPIAWESLGADNLESRTIHFFKSNSFIIDVPIGSISITVTRESLEYDNKTKQFIIATLNRVAQEHLEIVQDKINQSKTFYEACCAINTSGNAILGDLNLDAWNKSPYFIKVNNTSSRTSNVYFENSYLTKHLFGLHDVSITQYAYFNSPRLNGYKTNTLSVKMTDVYVLNRPKKVKKEEVKWRLRGVHRTFPNSTIYLINFDSADTSDAIRKGLLNGANIVNLEDYDIVKFSNNSNRRASYTSSGKSTISNDKTKSKVFTLNTDSSYDRYSKSENWEVADKNVLLNGSGVYVKINAYETSDCVFNTKTLFDIIERLKTVGVDIPTIYGIRQSVDTSNLPSGFIKFEKWMNTALQNHIDKNNLSEKIADYYALKNFDFNCVFRNRYCYEKIRSADFIECDLKQFLVKVKRLSDNKDEQIFAIINFCNDNERWYNYKLNIVLPESDLINSFKKLEAKYPLLNTILNSVIDDESLSDLVRYVQICNQISESKAYKVTM